MELLQWVEDRRQAVEAAVLRGGGSCGPSIPSLPSGGRVDQCDTGEEEKAAQGPHVCSRSTACSRQVRARLQLEEAAMGTLRSVGICVASKLRISRPWGGGRHGQG